MAEVLLDRPDIALWSDIEGTRLPIDILRGFDPAETYDSALVHFDGYDLPTEYRGEHRTVSVPCTARFVGTETGHTACVAFLALLRAARTAPDARLQLRTVSGLAVGFDDAYVGKVSSWGRPKVIGQVYDVAFTFDLVYATVEVG